eukprot:gene21137-28025_t
MSAQGQGVRLDSLDHQDLMGLKERLGGDLERFANSANVLLRTSQTFEQAGSSIASLAKSKEGQQVLLPLTQSLYVSGKIASVESVIVDVGTGYYVEMSCADGESYCKRKVSKLHNSLAGIQNVINEKQNQLVNVNQVISDKMQAAQAAQQQAAASSS